jgi:hypothetical protein
MHGGGFGHDPDAMTPLDTTTSLPFAVGSLSFRLSVRAELEDWN